MDWGNVFLEAVSSNQLLSHLFRESIVISIWVVLLLALRPFMKRLPRCGMYILWLVVAVRLICPVTMQGIYSFVPEQVETKIAETGQKMSASYLSGKMRRESLGGERNGYRLEHNTEKEVSAEVYPPDEAVEFGETKAVVYESSVGNKTDKNPVSLPTVLLVVWGAGVGIAVFLMMFSVIKTKWLLADAKTFEKGIYIHPLVENSFVAGIFRPRIYLSEEITGADREYVLAHERVHIKRKDYLIKPLYYLVCAVYWFNPLMWVAYYLMQKDMEVSCDEAVIRNMGIDSRKRYSYLLLSLSASRKGYLGRYTAFSVGVIRDRIASVMKYKKPTMAVTVCMACIVIMAGCGAVSAPVQDADEPLNKSGKDIYVEQMNEISDYTIDSSKKYSLLGVSQNSMGQMIEYVMDKSGVVYLSIWTGEKWEIQPAPWAENYAKAVKSKGKSEYVSFANAEIGVDGYLYITMSKYTEPVKKIYKENGKWYYSGTFLYKIDMKTGSLEEIELPQESVKESHEKKGIRIKENSNTDRTLSYGGKAMVPVMCEVGGDGRILVTDMMSVNCLYDTVGKKRQDLSIDFSKIDALEAGDGFFAYLERDEETKKQCIHFVDMTTGKADYFVELESEMKIDDEGGFIRNCCMGVSENTILMADSTGIYEMEYGEKSFRKVVDTETDNVYFLSQAGKKDRLDLMGVYKGNDGEYYVIQFDDGAEKLCTYRKNTSTKNGE